MSIQVIHTPMSHPSDLLAEVARKLGGTKVLGVAIGSQADLAMLVRQRVPLAALDELARAGLSEREIDSLVIPQRTRRHRAVRHEPLSVEESDRAVRFARIQSLAEAAFQDRDKANLWLRRTLQELGGASPLTTARTDAGARLVETIIGKIAWGAPA